VDEAQFLGPDQVWQLARVVDDLGVPVMCYGLRVDFQGKLFPGSAALLALADEMREARTICFCGRKATMVVRKDDTGRVLTDGRRSPSAATTATRASAAATGARRGRRATQQPRDSDPVRRRPALEEGDEVLHRHHPHRLPHLERGRPEMRQEVTFSSLFSASGTFGSNS
jgi:hypothetical protein